MTRFVALVLMFANLAMGSPQTRGPGWDEFERALDGDDAARAIEEAESLIERDQADVFARFALVRALAHAGDVEAAERAFREALQKGFVDFHRLFHDPKLAPLRESELGSWVIEHWRERQDARSEAEASALAEALGGRYEVIADERLRVRYLSALDDDLTTIAREEVERVARFAAALFPAPPEDRPDPWVLVLLPTPEDADRLLGRRDANGVYDHARKGLVVRDIGPSLRHEFFHALHWRHMERLGQVHPIWIREGLATLVEDVDDTPDGASLTVLGSWRTNTARRLAEIRRLRPWADFVTLSPKRFVSTRPVSNYAQARALMHWLHETGHLVGWYEAYTEHFDEDATGLESVKRSTGSETWAEDFRAWIVAQEEVGVPGRRNPVGLGIRLRDGGAGGPSIDQTGVVSDDGVRLRARDVIRSIDGQAVRTVRDVYRILGERDAGERVRLVLDRRGMTLEGEIVLVHEDDTLYFP